MLLTPERSEEMKARIQAAVERALLERDVSARRASLDVVGNDGLIRDIRAGRLPGVDRLEALFEYLGLEFYLGPRRRPSAAAAFAEPGAMSDLDRREALRAGYLPIPWHPQSPRPAGQAAPPVAFANAWLEGRAIDPARLAAVAADAGDGGGLVALVDTGAPRRGGPHAWACRAEGATQLRQVQFEPNVTVLLPEAPGRPALVLQGEERARLTLLGRVVWSGRLHPDGSGPAPG